MTGRELFNNAKKILYLFSVMVKILPPPSERNCMFSLGICRGG